MTTSSSRTGRDRPIAMFDSGFGGLTVARAVFDLLPDEHVVYFGDTARYPYGPRAHGQVSDFAAQIAAWLVENHDPKMIVVACNTAAAVALDELVALVDVPVIGVLEPGARSLLEVSSTGRVGVIGTVGTVSSGAYQRLVGSLDPMVLLTCAACPGFVEFVERGETDTDQVHVLAERLLAPMADAKIDSLLLGCTHYPFLARTIGDVMGRDVVLVSSADETAFEVRRVLERTGAGRNVAEHDGAAAGDDVATRLFVSSGDVDGFVATGRRLLGPELTDVASHAWAN